MALLVVAVDKTLQALEDSFAEYRLEEGRLVVDMNVAVAVDIYWQRLILCRIWRRLLMLCN